MYWNNMNQGKNTKATKKMGTEMVMANFTIVVVEFMKVIGKTIKWMDMESCFMNNL